MLPLPSPDVSLGKCKPKTKEIESGATPESETTEEDKTAIESVAAKEEGPLDPNGLMETQLITLEDIAVGDEDKKDKDEDETQMPLTPEDEKETVAEVKDKVGAGNKCFFSK